MDIPSIIKQVGQFASRNSSAILTATAAVGVVSTAVLAARGTVPAMRDIWQEESTRQEPLTPAEKVKLAWPYYVPAVGVGAATVICVVGAHTLSSKKNAALVTAYTVTERAFADYKKETRKAIGEKKESEIRSASLTNAVNEKGPSDLVIVPGSNDTTCYESLSGRYFLSTPEKIQRAEIKIKQRLLNGVDFSCSLNEFYQEIGIEPTQLGDDIGWNIDNMIDISLSSILIPGEMRPALAITYDNPPFPKYYGVRP